MDSAAQLALMTKAKKVFGADDTFLSFPVSPLPYTKRQLDFFSQDTPDDLRQSYTNLQAFSTLVNLIPSDEAWLPTETRFLWDVYEKVLNADFASSSRTSEEESAYQHALAYLRAPGDGGSWEDSSLVKTYRQHKDAYLLTQQKYLAAKSTAECATDPAEQQRWRDVDEPAQRAELDALQTQWIVAGYKNEVETAQSKVVSLGARSPIQTWAEWKGRFNRDIDSQTGARDPSMVYPSFFNPSNAVEEGAWQPFKLSEEEVIALLNEAPAEVRARLGVESTGSKVKSLSFEFSSAAISRSWFVSDALRARFWRFKEPAPIISDGGTPPSGECPAYVTAIVFARNVVMEQKQAEPTQPGIHSFPGFRFPAAVIDQTRLVRTQPERVAPTLPQHIDRPVPMMSRIVRDHRAVIAPPPAANVQIRNVAMRAAVVSPAAERPVTLSASASSLPNLRARSFYRLPQALVQPAPTPTSPPPIIQDESIYVLAFICKVVPKCPDPDLTLQW
jgi:hypothetical protein